jgi:serine/threonine protein kinase
MSKLIDQGGFGCVFYPGIECDGSTSKNPKYISKLHKKDHHVANEYNIGKMVTKIPLYNYYFAPIVNMCNIDIAKIDKRERDMCRVITREKNDSKFVITKMPYIKNVSLIKYITNPNIENKEIITYIMDSYKFLLNSLKVLNLNGVVHFDLKLPNILIDVKTKNPIVIDFGLSIPFKNIGPKTYGKYFYTYNAGYYIWPIDVHIINYINNVNSNLTQEELAIMVDTNIKENPALYIYSEGFIKRLRELTINIYKKYTNMPAQSVLTELIKNYNTWDNYSLSIMLLCLIGYISYDGFTDNKLIIEFSELLLLNIHPNASKRLSFDDTEKRYNKLFALDISVVGYENILNNFDKKIFSNRVINESTHQKKLSLSVLNKVKI